MLNRELEVTLNLAFKEARSKRHEFMTVEHLLLVALLGRRIGQQVHPGRLLARLTCRLRRLIT